MSELIQQQTEAKRATEIVAAGTDALFLLDRIMWELAEGAPLTGGKVTDKTQDDIMGLLKKAGI